MKLALCTMCPNTEHCLCFPVLAPEKTPYLDTFHAVSTFKLIVLTILRFNDSMSPLREKCPYLEYFWSIISRIRAKYEERRSSKTPNTDTFYALLLSSERIY